MKKTHNKHDAFGDQLERIYKEEYRKESMDKLDLKRSSPWRKIVIGAIIVLFLASASAWAGLLFFGRPQAFTSKETSLIIEGPKEITATANTTIYFKITNNENITLENNEVTAYLPNGFLLRSSNFQAKRMTNDELGDSKSNIYTFNLPEINSGTSNTVEIVGQVIAEKDKIITVGGKWRYQPKSLSSTYEQNASLDFKVNDANLALKVDYKPQAINLQEVELKWSIKNLGQEDLKNSRLLLDWPDQFTPTSIVYDSANKEAMTIEVESEAGEEEAVSETATGDNDAQIATDGYLDYTEEELKDIIDNKYIDVPFFKKESILNWKLIGQFNSSDNEPKNIKLSFATADAAESQIVLTEETAQFQIVREDLILEPTVNGQSGNSTLNFDTPANFSLKIKNKSKATLGGLKVKAVLDSSVLDWSSLTDVNKGQVGVNRIAWSSEQVPGLELMLPEDEVTISFSIATKPYSLLKTLGADKLKIASYFEVEINKIDTLETVKKVESSTIINTFNSNVELSARARYFDESGEAVGNGPLPPMSNQKTVYQIRWLITNSIHELENIKVEAELPAKAGWELTAKAEAGNIKLDGQKVIWEINRLPTSVDILEATFSISVIPTPSDVNKILSLLGATTLTATDKETGGQITISAPALNTNLDGDANAAGKGLIQP